MNCMMSDDYIIYLLKLHVLPLLETFSLKVEEVEGFLCPASTEDSSAG